MRRPDELQEACEVQQLGDVYELAGMEAKTEATPRFQSYGTRCAPERQEDKRQV